MNIVSALPYLNPVYTHQPTAFIVSRFLKGNGIKIATTLLQKQLREHPYFPSLLSVSDVLTSIGIKHRVFKGDFEVLRKCLFPLVHLSVQGGSFAIIGKIKGDQVQVQTEKGQHLRFSEEEFLKVWDGIIVTVDSDTPEIPLARHLGYPNYVKWGSALLASLSAFFVFEDGIPPLTGLRTLQLCLCACGLALSWLLVLQHLDKNNRLLQHICSSETSEGCGAVLGSKKAQIFPWLSMAEAGLIYFTGTAFLSLFFAESVLYYAFAILAPLFSIYAIYVQATLLKQWCRFCMAVHSIVLVNFVLMLTYGTPEFASQLGFARELSVFIIPFVLWLLLNPLVKELKDGAHYKGEFARLKFSPEIFTKLVMSQPKVHIPDQIKLFTFGDKQAKHELTFVSNPFCGPCSDAHKVIEKWLLQPLNFKITIIFTHSVNTDDPKRAFVERISNIVDSEQLQKVIGGWFADRRGQNIHEWARRFKLEEGTIPYDEHILNQWLEQADVRATPTFFINGYRVPASYRVADIRFLITEIP